MVAFGIRGHVTDYDVDKQTTCLLGHRGNKYLLTYSAGACGEGGIERVRWLAVLT